MCVYRLFVRSNRWYSPMLDKVCVYFVEPRKEPLDIQFSRHGQCQLPLPIRGVALRYRFVSVLSSSSSRRNSCVPCPRLLCFFLCLCRCDNILIPLVQFSCFVPSKENKKTRQPAGTIHQHEQDVGLSVSSSLALWSSLSLLLPVFLSSLPLPFVSFHVLFGAAKLGGGSFFGFFHLAHHLRAPNQRANTHRQTSKRTSIGDGCDLSACQKDFGSLRVVFVPIYILVCASYGGQARFSKRSQQRP